MRQNYYVTVRVDLVRTEMLRANNAKEALKRAIEIIRDEFRDELQGTDILEVIGEYDK
jgi:hypothetical protein